MSSLVGTVLFIEDDDDVRSAAALLLQRQGWRMVEARRPDEAWSVLATQSVDLVLLDLNFTRGATSGEEGLKGLQALIAHDPELAVVVVTGHSGINVAVAAMRAGAADFVMKPWSNERLMATLGDVLARRQQRRKTAKGEGGGPDAAHGTDPILGDSEAIERIRRLIQRAAATRAAVLIHGGPGAGKELVARTLHRQSGSTHPLLKIDLSARGTEAATLILDAPTGGAVLLDEIGGASLAVQEALVGALERRNELRLISTTRLARDALDGRLRQDLLYRLNTIALDIPPLHGRPDDVLLLARHYLGVFAHRHGQPLRPLSERAVEALTAAAWPGGVRELRTRTERAVLLIEGDAYTAADFDLGPEQAVAPIPPPSLAQTERALVEAALKRHSFNVSRAAAELGLTRAALYRRMAKHGL